MTKVVSAPKSVDTNWAEWKGSTAHMPDSSGYFTVCNASVPTVSYMASDVAKWEK